MFATCLQTIHREPSLLSAVVTASRETAGAKSRDRDGRIFIDRDPQHFRWILNYLRDGYIVTVPTSIQDRLELLQEARYYQLVGLVNLIEHQVVQTDPGNKFSFYTYP